MMTDAAAYWDAQVAAVGPSAAAWAEDGYDEAVVPFVVRVAGALRLSADPPKRYVLDIGCGHGRVLIPLAALYPETTFVGVDISAAMLAAMPRRPNVDAYLLDPSLCYAPAFDGVYSTLVAQHVDDATLAGLLATAAAWTAPRGRLLVQYATSGEPGPYSHPRTPGAMRDLLYDAGWTPADDRRDRRDDWRWVEGIVR